MSTLLCCGTTVKGHKYSTREIFTLVVSTVQTRCRARVWSNGKLYSCRIDYIVVVKILRK